MAPIYVTGCGRERLDAAIALHGEMFKTDPCIQFLLCHMPSEQRLEYIPKFIGTLLTAAALNGGILDEAWMTEKPGDPSLPPASSSIWLPPGRKVDSVKTYISAGMFPMAWKVGLTGLKKMLGEFQSKSDNAKKEGLVYPDGSKITRYYYLFFTSTAVEARGQGLCSELIKKSQAKATQEHLPIWLESTTPRSRRLYQKLGFKDVRSWILGKGVVDEDGYVAKDGKGVPVWAMIWLPESTKENKKEGAGVAEA